MSTLRQACSAVSTIISHCARRQLRHRFPCHPPFGKPVQQHYPCSVSLTLNILGLSAAIFMVAFEVRSFHIGALSLIPNDRYSSPMCNRRRSRRPSILVRLLHPSILTWLPAPSPAASSMPHDRRIVYCAARAVPYPAGLPSEEIGPRISKGSVGYGQILGRRASTHGRRFRILSPCRSSPCHGYSPSNPTISESGDAGTWGSASASASAPIVPTD